MFIENNVYSRGSAWYFSSTILGSILSNPNICFVITILLIEKVSLRDFKLLVRQLEIEPDLSNFKHCTLCMILLYMLGRKLV